jgi:hypothetical protein
MGTLQAIAADRAWNAPVITAARAGPELANPGRMTLAQTASAGSEARAPRSRAARRSDASASDGRRRREDAAPPDAGEESRWIPFVRALAIALLLGAAAGVVTAFWVTLVEAKGLVLGVGS